MVDKILYPQPIIPVGPREAGKPQKTEKSGQTSFSEVLNNQISSAGLKFSAHAQQRLAARNINLTQADLLKISNAIDMASQKGAKDSLILKDNLALVVSVKNKTVITAVDESSMKDHVFTKIDSAVII